MSSVLGSGLPVKCACRIYVDGRHHDTSRVRASTLRRDRLPGDRVLWNANCCLALSKDSVKAALSRDERVRLCPQRCDVQFAVLLFNDEEEEEEEEEEKEEEDGDDGRQQHDEHAQGGIQGAAGGTHATHRRLQTKEGVEVARARVSLAELLGDGKGGGNGGGVEEGETAGTSGATSKPVYLTLPLSPSASSLNAAAPSQAPGPPSPLSYTHQPQNPKG